MLCFFVKEEETLQGEDVREKEDRDDDDEEEDEEENCYIDSGNVDGDGEDNLDLYDDDLSDDDD